MVIFLFIFILRVLEVNILIPTGVVMVLKIMRLRRIILKIYLYTYKYALEMIY